MANKIQLRRDTAANWTAANPVLAQGEPGIELDTGHAKYGDGVKNWKALPYVGADNFLQAGTGAVPRTLQSKLRDVVHIDDFNRDLSAAIDATPIGGVLQLGPGAYIGKVHKDRSDITIRGSGRPSFGPGNKNLIGGSIIQGHCSFNGSRIRIESLGFDCGETVCTALNAGTAMDGLFVLDPARTTLTDISVVDVAVLGKDPSAPYHCMLLEGVKNCYVQNIHTRYNQWGIVLKAQDTIGNGLFAAANSTAAVAVKGDSYAVVSNVQLTNVMVDSADYTGGGTGVFVYAATGDCANVGIANFITKGFAQGVKIACDVRATLVNTVDNLTLVSGSIYDAATFGIEAFGALNSVLIDTVNIYDTKSGNSIRAYSDGLGINLSNVVASAPAAINNITNVDLAGRFNFDQLLSIRGGDRGQLAGININPDSSDRSMATIGGYRGNLFAVGNAATVTLANGWTPYFSTVTIRSQSNRTQLYGRVNVPALPWTGKEKIGSIPGALAPNTQKHLITYGYAGANLHLVGIEIEQNGDITCEFLNTSTIFPAGITHIGLDGLSWLIHE